MTAIVHFNAFKLYLFILLMMSHDIICSPEFVLFNNVILCILFDNIAKLLLSIMIGLWLEETKESLILVTSLHKYKMWC